MAKYLTRKSVDLSNFTRRVILFLYVSSGTENLPGHMWELEYWGSREELQPLRACPNWRGTAGSVFCMCMVPTLQPLLTSTVLYIFTRMPWWRHRPWRVFLHGVPCLRFITCLSILRAVLRLVSSQVALLDLLAVTRRWAKSLERNTEFTAQSLRPFWYPWKINCPATFSIKW